MISAQSRHITSRTQGEYVCALLDATPELTTDDLLTESEKN